MNFNYLNKIWIEAVSRWAICFEERPAWVEKIPTGKKVESKRIDYIKLNFSYHFSNSKEQRSQK